MLNLVSSAHLDHLVHKVPQETKGQKVLREQQGRTDLTGTPELQVWLVAKETWDQAALLVFLDQREKMVALLKPMALLVHVVLPVHKVNPDKLVNKDILAKINLVALALLVTTVPQDPKELQVNLVPLDWSELKVNKEAVITAPPHVPHQVIKLLLEGSFHFEWLSFPSVFVFIFFVQSLWKQIKLLT